MGSTRVPALAYAIGTVVGMAPRTFAAVFVASQAKSLIDAETQTPTWVIYAGIALTVVVVLVIGHIANNAIKRVTAPQPAAPLPLGVDEI